MPEHVQDALVAAIVLFALLFLVGHFSGATTRFRRRRKPDVPVARLLRKKPKAEPGNSDA